MTILLTPIVQTIGANTHSQLRRRASRRVRCGKARALSDDSQGLPAPPHAAARSRGRPLAGQAGRANAATSWMSRSAVSRPAASFLPHEGDVESRNIRRPAFSPSTPGAHAEDCERGMITKGLRGAPAALAY